MEKTKNIDFTNQVYITSFMSVFLSPLLGIGFILAIPSLVFAFNIKKNYIGHDAIKIDKCIFYSIMGIGLSIIFFLMEKSFMLI